MSKQAREAALATVAEHGWHVFRVKIGHDKTACDGGTKNCKTVRPVGSWTEDSSNDPEVVGGWAWSGVSGYGIDCGKSGLWVADVDPGGQWADEGTRVHGTGRGTHYLYEDLYGLPSRQSAWPHVDTRGVGGMVIGPGSHHPHGEYAVLVDAPVAPVPAWVIAEARAAPAKVAAPTADYTGPAYADLTAEQQDAADQFADADLFDWQARLAVAANWDEGMKDDHLTDEHPEGRGWELLARDFAWWCSIRAATPWLPPVDGQTLFAETLPEAMRENEKCQKKVDPEKAAHLVPLPPWVDPVFDATPVLRHLRAAAHARGVPAPGVLAAVLARVLLLLDPGVTLPPVVGSSASLNLGFALVGASGDSKSAAGHVATELLGEAHIPEEWVKAMGSGEGMIDAFYTRVPKDPAKPEGTQVTVLRQVEFRRALLMLDEGETLRRLSERSGTTLGGFLRMALTGEMLGTTNSLTGGRTRHVPARSYRLVVLANIHPTQADVLLDGDGVGMPQRFLWQEAGDPALPRRVEDMPAWPGPLPWTPPDLEPRDLDYPEHIKREVRQGRLDRAHGLGDPRAGHATLTRLKVAVALAVLHGEEAVTDQWWALAGTLSEQSLALQSACAAGLADASQAKQTRRRVTESRADEAALEDRLERAVKAVVSTLRKQPGQTRSWRDVKPASRLLREIETADVIQGLEGQVGVTVEAYTGSNKIESWRLRFDG